MTETIGSFMEFATTAGLDPNCSSTIDMYTRALALDRERLAEERGVSLDQLHFETEPYARIPLTQNLGSISLSCYEATDQVSFVSFPDDSHLFVVVKKQPIGAK